MVYTIDLNKAEDLKLLTLVEVKELLSTSMETEESGDAPYLYDVENDAVWYRIKYSATVWGWSSAYAVSTSWPNLMIQHIYYQGQIRSGDMNVLDIRKLCLQ